MLEDNDEMMEPPTVTKTTSYNRRPSEGNQRSN